MVVMAPGDAYDLPAMLAFSLKQDSPCSLRYPKASAEQLEGEREAVELGRAEVIRWGTDGAILCCGTLLGECVRAAELLQQKGLELSVINARFVKPLDKEIIARSLHNCPYLLTVEEGQLMGGFGSAVLEAVNEVGLDARRVHRLGVPDRFTEHGSRGELLAQLGLDAAGITKTCCELSGVLIESAEGKAVG